MNLTVRAGLDVYVKYITDETSGSVRLRFDQLAVFLTLVVGDVKYSDRLIECERQIFHDVKNGLYCCTFFADLKAFAKAVFYASLKAFAKAVFYASLKAFTYADFYTSLITFAKPLLDHAFAYIAHFRCLKVNSADLLFDQLAVFFTFVVGDAEHSGSLIKSKRRVFHDVKN